MAQIKNSNFNKKKLKNPSTDKKIDLLVYELYGLTEEEIKVVEGE